MPFTNSCASITTFYPFLFPVAQGSPSTIPEEGVGVVAHPGAVSQTTYRIPSSRKALARLAVHWGRQPHDPAQGTCPSPGLGHLQDQLDAASAPQ